MSSPHIGLRQSQKTLLVCAENCPEIERRLIAAGCAITKVADGDSAIGQVHREMFDAAVLVSTGDDMDLVETALNLTDIRSAMTIVIVSDRTGATDSVLGKLTATVPNAIQIRLRELDALLDDRRPGFPAKVKRIRAQRKEDTR
ncbi:MAG TPA: hypothetical protein VNN13_13590 [Methylomirabilota bacterium]|nr:hypothetical protein [Methylomirabilota bacterium]